jgi:hypothetical protein
MLAETIDEVVERLDEVIDWARGKESRLGYFPALYRNVTLDVRAGIQELFFDDGARMERLDVAFANRYLEALDRYRRGERPGESWGAAFSACESWWAIVLQHLLLGMNAHINLDLGIAAAAIAPGREIRELESDFTRVNEILARRIADTQGRLARIWPALKLLDRLSGRADDAIINFSISRARACAWRVACDLAPLDAEDRRQRIEQLDREIKVIAGLIARPGPLKRIAVAMVRIGERGGVPEIIDFLR